MIFDFFEKLTLFSLQATMADRDCYDTKRVTYCCCTEAYEVKKLFM